MKTTFAGNESSDVAVTSRADCGGEGRLTLT
jgi:hypothetical protein